MPSLVPKLTDAFVMSIGRVLERVVVFFKTKLCPLTIRGVTAYILGL
jgi:hypothetical protein